MFCAHFFVTMASPKGNRTLTSFKVGGTSTTQKMFFLVFPFAPTLLSKLKVRAKGKNKYIYLALCSVFSTFVPRFTKRGLRGAAFPPITTWEDG